MRKRQILSFPHMGDYHVPIRGLLQNLFPQDEIRPAPPITKKTVALGARYGPEFICEPFKLNLGNYIEALEHGATILLQTGTGCRYGYYSRLQEEILRDLGYDFTFLHLSRKNAYPLRAYKTLKSVGMECGVLGTGLQVARTIYAIHTMDKLADFLRKHQATSEHGAQMPKLYQDFLLELENVESFRDIFRLSKNYGQKLKNLANTACHSPIKVGIVGDLYTVMEPSANAHVEAFLIERGIEIHRKMSVSFLLGGSKKRKIFRKSEGHLAHHIGANGTDSVLQTLDYAEKGFDGIIQLKSFGCTPELNAAPALQQISREFEVPVLQLSFGTHQSETGLYTRLEAFCDILEMRKQANERDAQPRRGHRLDFNQRRTAGW